MTRFEMMPRRSELPACLVIGLAIVIFVYSDYRFEMDPLWWMRIRCESSSCIVSELGIHVAVIAGGFLASYLASTVLRRTLNSRLNVADLFPRVFHPPRDVAATLVAISVLSLAIWLAAMYQLLYSHVTAAVLYTLYFPFLNGIILADLLPNGIPFSMVATAVIFSGLATAQAAWWYVLAYGLTGGYQRLMQFTSGWNQSS